MFRGKRVRCCLAPAKLCQVTKLCALAHIELAPDEEPMGRGLSAAAVQRDVGAMLKCMATMRDERGASSPKHPEEVNAEGRDEGPWGGAARWATPLQEVGL